MIMQLVKFHCTEAGSRVCSVERLSICEKPLHLLTAAAEKNLRHYSRGRKGYVSWNAVSSSAADGDELLRNTWK